MTDLSPLLAEARRIAELIKSSPGIATGNELRLAALALALIPVAEAAEAKQALDVNTRAGEDAHHVLQEALATLPTTLNKALKP